MNNKLLSIHQAADILGVSTKTLRRWDKKGILVPKRTEGNQRRYERGEIERFKNKGTVGTSNFQAKANDQSLSLVPSVFEQEQKKKIFNLNSLQTKIILSGLSLMGGLFILSVSLQIVRQEDQVKPRDQEEVFSESLKRSVLGEHTNAKSLLLNVNIASKFNNSAQFLEGLSAANLATFSAGLTAPNVLYGLTAGDGVSIGTGQTPIASNSGVLSLGGKTGAFSLGSGISIDGFKISNSDTGSSQKIFKTIKVGSDSFSAGSNTDTLELAAGTGISLSADTTNKKITVTGSSSSGWTDDGTTVRLTTSTDSVGIGTTSPSTTLHLVGTSTFTSTSSFNGGVTLGDATSDALTIYSRVTVGNDTTGNALEPTTGSKFDLGSSTRTWRRLYVDTLNVGTETSIAGTNEDDFRINADNATADTENSSLTFERGTPATNTSFRWRATGTPSKLISLNVPFWINPDSGVDYSGTAALIVDQPQSQDILTASSSATTRFRISNAGHVLPGADNSYDLGSTSLGWRNIYLAGQIFSGSSGTVGHWQRASGSLAPTNITDDLLLGATASSSARFAVLNMAGGTPTASVSAGTAGGAFLTADGYLSTTARQSLTLGNSSSYNTTGNVLINPNGTGNVGIGVTAPTATLHVVGQCVTGDTLLKRRRRRRHSRKSGNPWVPDQVGDDNEWEWEDIRIDQIKEGDEILTLDETTGEFVPQRIEKLMDMDVQEVFELITRSGFRIKTTGSHPYLVLQARKQPKLPRYTIFEIDQSMRVEDRSSNTILSIANKESSFLGILSRREKQILYSNFQKSGRPKLFGPETFGRLIVATMKKFDIQATRLIIDLEYSTKYDELITKIVEEAFPGIIVHIGKIGKHSPAHLAAIGAHRSSKKKKREGAARSNLKGFRAAELLHPEFTGIRSPHSLSTGSNYITAWTKVKYLKPGMTIATIKGWEHISAIVPRGHQQTYDIQVRGTHNFVGNGIVAHNTYINSSTATGTALDIDSNSLSSGYGIDISSTSTAGTGSSNSRLLNLTRSGANTNATHTAYGLYSSVTNTGTTSTNIGGYFTASGATSNYGLIVDSGNVGIGDTSPAALLTVGSGDVIQMAGTGLITIAPTTTGTLLDYALETEWTFGTLINADFASATTQSGGDVTGVALNFNTNVTGAVDLDVTGVNVQTPALSPSSGATTTTYIGYNNSASGAITTSGTFTGTANWRGANLTMPNITQISGSTVNATGLLITNGTITTAGTQNMINLSASGVGAGSLNGINIPSITAGEGTERAISIAQTGWNAGIYFATGNAGAEIYFDQSSSTNIVSEETIFIDIDENNNGANDSFIIRNGGDATIFSTEEDGDLLQGNGTTTTSKTTNFFFLNTTAGAPTGSVTNPTGMSAMTYDDTNNKLCLRDGAAWLCSAALADIAEWVPAPGAESGDLVSVTNQPNPVDDPTAPSLFGKTTKPYDAQMAGIISQYAEEAQSAQGYKLSEDYHAMTLVGRVPVKVSLENGSIQAGDYLTSSSTPGVGMKATKSGRVIGMALESSEQCSNLTTEQCKIMVFVNVGWHDPSLYIATDGNLNSSSVILEGAQATDRISSGDSIASLQNDNNISSSQTTFNLGSDSLFKDLSDKVSLLEARINELVASASTSALLSSVIASEAKQSQVDGIASSSLDALGTPRNDILDLDSLDIKDGTVSGSLMVLGRTTVTDLGVTGNINAGLLSIHGLDTLSCHSGLSRISLNHGDSGGADAPQNDGEDCTGATINTLSGNLFLQNEGLGGIDILAGKITIDTKGNMIVAGTITAESIQAEEFRVLGTKTIGTSTILAGQTSIEVATPAANTNSKIFLTPTTVTDRQLAVTYKTDGKFRVEILEKDTSQISFDWWIVN